MTGRRVADRDSQQRQKSVTDLTPHRECQRSSVAEQLFRKQLVVSSTLTAGSTPVTCLFAFRYYLIIPNPGRSDPAD